MTTGNLILDIEYVLIGTIIVVQLIFFVKILHNIYLYKGALVDQIVLDSDELIDDDQTEIYNNTFITPENVVKLHSKSYNIINERIVFSINSYLAANYNNTVNYSIVKDIIDREIEAKDEEITNLIPIPLYLGLSATIIGIIFGLFAVDSTLLSDSIETFVQPLLDGVKVAMFATFFGLVLTIALSAFIYQNAHEQVLKDKNILFSYLQAKLLPVIMRSEDEGVVALRNSLDKFSRQSVSIIKQFDSVVDKTTENLRIQQDLINRLDKMNVTKISKTNLELFMKLEANMEAFNHFSSFLNDLGRISENLSTFSQKASNIDSIATEISDTVRESRQLVKFLESHLSKIEDVGNRVTNSIDKSENRVSEAINSLNNSTTIHIQSMKNLSDNLENELGKIFGLLKENLQTVADAHIDELTNTYRQAVPDFENLGHLSGINSINDHLVSIIDQLPTWNGHADQYSTKLENLGKTLIQLDQILKRIENNTVPLKNLRSSPMYMNDRPHSIKIKKLWSRFLNWISPPFKRKR